MIELLVLLLFLLFALYGAFSLIVGFITGRGLLKQLKELECEKNECD